MLIDIHKNKMGEPMEIKWNHLVLSEAVKELRNHSDVGIRKVAGIKTEVIRWRDGYGGCLVLTPLSRAGQGASPVWGAGRAGGGT